MIMIEFEGEKIIVVFGGDRFQRAFNDIFTYNIKAI